MTNSKLPEKESDFFALLSDYFPCFFDIKYIMKSCESLKGGLNRIAETLEVKRVGPSHQVRNSRNSSFFFSLFPYPYGIPYRQ